MSLAKGARQNGVTIAEGVKLTGIEVENGRVRAVVTDGGRIACDKLVICAGQWSREIGHMAGVNIPLVSVQHQYLITDTIDGVTSSLPTLRDPDRLTYWKEEVGGLVMGGYEPNPKPWAVDRLPDNFEFQLLEDDLEHFEPLLELAAGRVPAMQSAGIKQFINGPESFTPDGNFILGEAPEVRGVFVGAGFNAFGIASGGGAGMVLAEWVAKGEPPYDLWPVDIRRFGRNHLDTSWVRTRTLEAYAKHYTMAWPFEEYRSGPTAYAARRSTPGSRRKAPASARSSAGNGRTGLPIWRAGRRPRTSTATSGRTGSLPLAASTRQPASASPCSTRPRSPSSFWSAAMRKRRSRGSPPTMWRSRRVISSTRRC